jgi:hypothetical protein
MKEEIVSKLVEYIEGTKDFVLEQAPEILKEALRYEYLSSLFISISSGVLLVLALSVFYYAFCHPMVDKYGDRSFGSGMTMIVSAFVAVMVSGTLCISIDKIIKINVAPKYFLLTLLLKINQ